MTSSRYSLKAIIGLALLDFGVGLMYVGPFWPTVLALACVNISIILIINGLLDVIQR